MRCFKIIAILLFSLAVTTNGQSAKEILEKSGVKGGLVVHVGCGDGKRTVELQANENSLVHGLDTDSEKVKAARATIMARC